MAEAIVIPRFQEEEPKYIILSHWFKEIGDFVKEGEPIVEIETDKAVMEVPSETNGTLLYKVAKEDEKLMQHSLIAIVGDIQEQFEDYQYILSEYGISDAVRPANVHQRMQNKPKRGTNVFVAPNATVVGNVTLGSESSIWYQAVLRADEDEIIVGNRSNIQDGCIIHCDQGKPAVIGQSVTVGHGAIIHGAEIGDYSLIGMRATVLNGAKIGKYCVIGAHALVTENMVIPDFSVVMGTPGKVVKQLPEDYKRELEKAANTYVHLGEEYTRGVYKEL